MNLAFVVMHTDCPDSMPGAQPPKFEITDFSEDSTQTRLQCTLCGLELTLTCHTADNPATPLSTEGLPDGSERPHQLHRT
jgi:hypothetical protein